MSNKFEIKVTGGQVAFGSASQGDRNHVEGHASLHVVERRYDEARTAIEHAARDADATAVELKTALAHLALLKKKAADEAPEVEQGAGILRTARENFSWAYPMFKDFAKVAWPAVLALIGG